MAQATVTSGSSDFEMVATIRNHKVIIDESAGNGGQDKGAAPTEMLCASLASCTAITIKMYLNHKQWKTDGITVDVSQSANAEGKNVFSSNIEVKGAFDAEQKNRILAIANKCPVHKALEAGNIIETVVV